MLTFKKHASKEIFKKYGVKFKSVSKVLNGNSLGVKK
jgi:hypothetical protein